MASGSLLGRGIVGVNPGSGVSLSPREGHMENAGQRLAQSAGEQGLS
jgi:hypothetical protein